MFRVSYRLCIENVVFMGNKKPQYSRYIDESFLDYFTVNPQLEFYEGGFIEKIKFEKDEVTKTTKCMMTLKEPIYSQSHVVKPFHQMDTKHIPFKIKNCKSDYDGRDIIYIL